MIKRGRPPLGFKKMFWDRIYPEPNTGCWIWAGPSDSFGYGNCPVILNGEKVTRAHRVSYIVHNGPIYQNLLVCHKCDNTWCVNPDHLFLGTAKDNIQDAISKGRCVNLGRHENRHTKINAENAKSIRYEYFTNGYSQESIANRYKISQVNVSAICTGKIWRTEE